jgi:hypothetical protein
LSVHERLYRSLLVVYPREYRSEYAEPMTQLLRDRLRDEGGGGRTAVVWINIGLDLIRTALAERKVTTMDTFKAGWWRYSAGLIAFSIAFLAIGNLFADDEGPFSGKLAAAGVAALAAGTIVTGLRLRERNKRRGSTLIGIGTLPGAILVVVFWFPPIAALGLLCLATAAAAFSDAVRREPGATAG